MSLILLDSANVEDKTLFSEEVIRYSNQLGINPNWLMLLMEKESGINPKAKNIIDGRIVASGLIQFTKRTAEGLGTSHSELLSMSAFQQMWYVFKYFEPYKNRIKSYEDLYLVTFFPLAIGKSDSFVLETDNLSAQLIAQQNPGINLNKDNKITLGEFKEYVKRTIPEEYKSIILGDDGKILKSLFIIAILFGVIYYYNS